MFNTPKILLSIELQGGVAVRSNEKVYIPYKILKKELYKELQNKFKFRNLKPDDIALKGAKVHYPLETRPALKKISLSLGAVLHFQDPQALPSWMERDNPHLNKKAQKWWKNLTDEERLEIHLERIAQHERGISYSYELLED